MSDSLNGAEVLPIAPEPVDDPLSTALSIVRQAAATGSMSVEASDALLRATSKLKSRTAKELRNSAVLAAVINQYDFLKIDSFSKNDELKVWFKHKSGHTYHPFDLYTAEEIIEKEFRNVGYDCDTSLVKEIHGMIGVKPWKHISYPDNRLIKISNAFFWDKQEGRIIKNMYDAYDYPYDGVFREMFDGNQVGSAPDVSIKDVAISPAEVEAVYNYLQQHDGLFLAPTTPISVDDIQIPRSGFESEEIWANMAPILSERLAENIRAVLDVFWVWANNESVDTLNDLLKVCTMLFLKEMPKRFVILDGDRRNGKSAFLTLLETMFGGNNCTQIPMKALIDPHRFNDLLLTWVNIPREDYDFDDNQMKEGVAFLKNMATHEPVPLTTFYKQFTTNFVPRFLPVFPRNGTPDFGKVEGGAAVMIRMRAIRFNNDLSEKDNSGRNFEKETYTPEFCSTLLTMTLAMAKYYNEHTFEFSNTSMMFGERIKAIADPATYFLDELSKWFDNVGAVGYVTKQAELFFNNQGFDWNGDVMRAIKAKLLKMDSSRVKYVGHGETRARGYKIPKNKAYPRRLTMFAEDAKLAALGNRSPQEYYKSLSNTLMNMNPQEARERRIPSIIEALREFDEDEHHAGKGSAIAAQEGFEREFGR